MNTSELIDAVAAANSITKADAKKVVETVFEVIAGAAAKGDEVSVNGFGKFKVKESAAREGRNPSTGATIKVPAKTVVKFKVTKDLADAVA